MLNFAAFVFASVAAVASAMTRQAALLASLPMTDIATHRLHSSSFL